MYSSNPNCFWTYNCGAKDYDFYATWENLTVQRNNLQYIRISLYYWNEIDGWETKSQTFVPPNAPTSDPYTFTIVGANVFKTAIKTMLVKNTSLVH